jgi:hypothetical protein
MLFSQRGINFNKISVCLSIYLSFQIANLPSRIIPGGDDTTILTCPNYKIFLKYLINYVFSVQGILRKLNILN